MRLLLVAFLFITVNSQSQGIFSLFGGLNSTSSKWDPSYTSDLNHGFTFGLDLKTTFRRFSPKLRHIGLGSSLAYLNSFYAPPISSGNVYPHGSLNFSPYFHFNLAIKGKRQIVINPFAGLDLRFGKKKEELGLISNSVHSGWTFGGFINVYRRLMGSVFRKVPYEPQAFVPYARRKGSMLKGYSFGYRATINSKDLESLGVSGGYLAHNFTLGVILGAPQPMRVVKKPALYFYPEDELDSITLTVNPVGQLTYTYPHFDRDITFSAKTNGDLKYGDLSLDYIFFESTYAGHLDDFIYEQGAVVQKENYLEFIESQMTVLGLNDKEKEQFITYWMPELIKYKSAFIRFLINEECDLVAKIDVSPKPQNTNRVYMLFTPNPSASILPQPQRLKTFDRSGFDVLEWGGFIQPEAEKSL